jgi:hypothetical protein
MAQIQTPDHTESWNESPQGKMVNSLENFDKIEKTLSLPTRKLKGSVVQLVRMPPCHGGGRGFESRPVRKEKAKPALEAGFAFLYQYPIFLI